ncbi:MAG: redoxin domain-containing protein [Bryobacterales bacterium]|nr:redoxin domain-containing protein [Acidobacteriota bacterium]MCB9384783.1 redoxin domain-containing protein [Bryobacterales bacterium]
MPIQPGTVNAPEFPEGLDWLNTERPLTMRELRGKIVLLDFWTYCCINCMHVLPELERLERKWKDELVVIGVHSAKFLGEKQTENIRQAVLRYEIAHPVVNDHSMQVWQEYAVRAWPSFMLIDPNGKIIGTHSGERVYDLFDGVIAQMVEHFDGEGTLDRKPVSFALEKARQPESVLSFPGKVLADDAGDRLFIADTNHNRIVIASLSTGNVLDIVGSGEAGFSDGSFAEAMLDHPQGMAVEGDLLYIADTDNHAIRRADLRARQVVTLAGDGEQAEDFDNRPGTARGRRLNSPWDLDLAHGVLFIAMAGQHQIWGLDLEEFYIAGHAGSGQEDHVDGPLLAASLAQPSGLTHDDSTLFVADSEVSSIRAVDLDPRGGHVRTVVGEGLFDFGDIDGGPKEARLQHPLDVEYVEGTLFVADTYNNKIKTIGLHTRNVRTFCGSGGAGLVDGDAEEARFDEPGGLSSARGKLFVADTNNHVIRVVDIESGEAATFALQDAHKLARRSSEVEQLPPAQVRPGEVALRITCALPEGSMLNPAAPSHIEVQQGGDLQVLAFEGEAVTAKVRSEQPVRIETSIYYCEEDRQGVCLYAMQTYTLGLEEASSGPAEAVVELAL